MSLQFFPHGFNRYTESAAERNSGLVASLPKRLWLDFSDYASMTDDGGGVISFVRDKSGNNNNATATLTERPTFVSNAINGQGALSFNGTSNFLTIPTINLTAEMSVFAVVTTTLISSAVRTIVANSANTKKFGMSTGTPIKTFVRVVSSSDATQNFPLAVNTGGIMGISRNAADKVDLYNNNITPIRLFADAAQTGTFDPNRIANDNVSNRWIGFMSELIITNKASDATMIFNYLKKKYNV